MLIRISISIESDIMEIYSLSRRSVTITPTRCLGILRDVINSYIECNMPTDGTAPVMAHLSNNEQAIKLELPLHPTTDLDLVLDEAMDSLDSHNALSEEDYVELRAGLDKFANNVNSYLIQCLVPISLAEIKAVQIEWIGPLIVGEIDV